MALQEERWIHRLDSYEKAFCVLERIFLIKDKRELTEAEQMGLIQAFEFSYELAWKLMKDFLYSKGFVDLIGSKDSIRQAFSSGVIENGEIWMNMLDSRNETTHTYDEEIAAKVVADVSNSYIKEMKSFLFSMKKRKQEK